MYTASFQLIKRESENEYQSFLTILLRTPITSLGTQNIKNKQDRIELNRDNWFSQQHKGE